jgi:hypothetical protein
MDAPPAPSGVPAWVLWALGAGLVAAERILNWMKQYGAEKHDRKASDQDTLFKQSCARIDSLERENARKEEFILKLLDEMADLRSGKVASNERNRPEATA